MLNDPCPLSSDAPPCELHRVCRAANESRWAVQEQRNAATDALLRRWTGQFEILRDGMAECKEDIAKGRDHSQQVADAMEHMQKESRRYMDATTNVLKELAENMRSWREASENNHASLMAAVSANAAVAARAVDRADQAAGRADEARRASGESAGRLSVMTRATLAGWVVASGAAAALGWHLAKDYGWPAILSLLQKLK